MLLIILFVVVLIGKYNVTCGIESLLTHLAREMVFIKEMKQF
jgi:hypothetical protein